MPRLVCQPGMMEMMGHLISPAPQNYNQRRYDDGSGDVITQPVPAILTLGVDNKYWGSYAKGDKVHRYPFHNI